MTKLQTTLTRWERWQWDKNNIGATLINIANPKVAHTLKQQDCQRKDKPLPHILVERKKVIITSVEQEGCLLSPQHAPWCDQWCR